MADRVRMQIDCTKVIKWAARRRALNLGCTESAAVVKVLEKEWAKEIEEAKEHFKEKSS